MPELNRRNFMQIAGAASLAPMVPALPAAAATPSSGLSSAKLLWKGMYAQAGGTGQMAGVAKSMGVSGQVVRNVVAKTVHGQAIAVQTARRFGNAKRVGPASAKARPSRTCIDAKKIKANLKTFLKEEKVEDPALATDEVFEIDEPNMPETPETE